MVWSLCRKVGTNAYRLKLPHILHCHPVFNDTAHKVYEQNQIPDRKQATPPPVTDLHGHTRYIVEGILKYRKIRNRIQYLVKWQGYHDAPWKPEIHLKEESGNDIIALQHYKASFYFFLFLRCIGFLEYLNFLNIFIFE